jgi:transcription elongation GreA/GreB family factor
MTTISQQEELRNRVLAKKKDLEARLELAKADTRHAARERIEQVEKRLEELEAIVKRGWDDATEDIAKKLNAWLTK